MFSLLVINALKECESCKRKFNLAFLSCVKACSFFSNLNEIRLVGDTALYSYFHEYYEILHSYTLA